jgi:hypothetical protein
MRNHRTNHNHFIASANNVYQSTIRFWIGPFIFNMKYTYEGYKPQSYRRKQPITKPSLPRQLLKARSPSFERVLWMRTAQDRRKRDLHEANSRSKTHYPSPNDGKCPACWCRCRLTPQCRSKIDQGIGPARPGRDNRIARQRAQCGDFSHGFPTMHRYIQGPPIIALLIGFITPSIPI